MPNVYKLFISLFSHNSFYRETSLCMYSASANMFIRTTGG